MVSFIAAFIIIIAFFISLSFFAMWSLRWQRRIDEYMDIYRKRSERRAVYLKDNYTEESLILLCDEVIGSPSFSDRVKLDGRLSSIAASLNDSVLIGFESELISCYSSYKASVYEYRQKCRRWYNRMFCSILDLDRRGRFEL